MRICIPTEDDLGMEGKVCGHFGSAPFYTLVDTESGSCETIGNSHDKQGHGACAPVDRLRAHQLDAIVCKGMGRRAIAALSRAGVDILLTEEMTVSRAVAAARQSRLRLLSPQDACSGHWHGHGHTCGHLRR